MSGPTPRPLDPTVETWALEFPGALTRQAIEAIQRQLEEAMPGKRVLVVQECGHFRALESLDAAWAEAEAASRSAGGTVRLDGGLNHYSVMFYRVGEDPQNFRAPTPVAALRAMTAKLREASHGA